jgi:SAM-dependent methyltransferase
MSFNIDKKLPVTNKSIEDYAIDLEIEIDGLKEKDVLDIGSGGGDFQSACNKLGARVIGMDPHYQNISDPLRTVARPQNREDKIAGINETLPFRDNIFDFVLSCSSSFYYLPYNYPDHELREKAAREMFEEVIRVLKPGGQAHIGAFYKEGKKTHLKRALFAILKNPDEVKYEFHNRVLVLTKRY